MTLTIDRRFKNKPWPAVLVEIKDFVELTRLITGGVYRRLTIEIVLADGAVPLDGLNSLPIQEFLAWLEAIPCNAPGAGGQFFRLHPLPYHWVNLTIER